VRFDLLLSVTAACTSVIACMVFAARLKALGGDGLDNRYLNFAGTTPKRRSWTPLPVSEGVGKDWQVFGLVALTEHSLVATACDTCPYRKSNSKVLMV
jgi:hypothetical protein